VDGKGLPRRKIRVIHNGCDLERFQPGKVSPHRLRARLGFHDTDLIMVVVGRLEPQKGHRVLLEALPTVVQQHPRARLVCVGEGALRDELEAEAERRGLSSVVRFVGYQDNVPEWMALADVFVLPSLFEGLPLVVIEALAAERAVVATAVDGTPEIIVDGRTGLTVPPGDARALAVALDRVLRDPELRGRLAQAGRQWVLERFTQESQVRKTQELYLEAWDRGRQQRSTALDVATASERNT
jgi:glycosyltransferase involved in cell wall biosynthesis